MATIKQIARMAGVSPTTVSNVLHGNTAKVSPATLEKVRAILREEKYAPNMGAIILARSASRIVGVIMFMEPRSDETVLEDPFVATILGAIEEEIRRAGYFMMLHTTTDEDEVLRLAETWKLDGLVLFWVPDAICGIIRRSIDTPVVFVDCYFSDDGLRYHNIGLDDEAGGYEMARHLLSMGHGRIAFLANGPDFPCPDRARFAGCVRAFRERGLALGDDAFMPLPKDRGRRLAIYERLGAAPRPCSALFFSSDYHAAEAMSHLQDLGVEIPGELSIAGFDDDILSRVVRPRLTTVHQDVLLKGRGAVAMLMRLMKGEEVDPPALRFPVRLVVRDSVAANGPRQDPDWARRP